MSNRAMNTNVKPELHGLAAQLHELYARNLIAAAQRELRMASALATGQRAIKRNNSRRTK